MIHKFNLLEITRYFMVIYHKYEMLEWKALLYIKIIVCSFVVEFLFKAIIYTIKPF